MVEEFGVTGVRTHDPDIEGEEEGRNPAQERETGTMPHESGSTRDTRVR